jgi:hypothetical protein
MSMSRRCPNCFQAEGLRVNFGFSSKAEKDFHKQKWCKCGYETPEEMMKDQDMGFEDPVWITIAKSFLEEYHLRLSQGHIKGKAELVRFFLRSLKESAYYSSKSITLVGQKTDEGREWFDFGKTKQKPRTDIFKREPLFYATMAYSNLLHSSKVLSRRHSRNRHIFFVVVGLIIGFMVGRLW